MFPRVILMMITMGMLVGCISGRPTPDTYTDKSGKVTIIENDHEQCVRACNDDYARCMDTEPAQQNPVVGSPDGMFGASSDCRDDLHKCLPTCNGR